MYSAEQDTGHTYLRKVQGKARRVEASMQVTVAWESIQEKLKHKMIPDTLSEAAHKNRDIDIARKCKAHRSKNTSHSHLQGNTRHTQYQDNTRHTQEAHDKSQKAENCVFYCHSKNPYHLGQFRRRILY